MGLPKEPRQKMINLMYLVLTALLALNVSNEILNAFKIVDQSLGKSNTASEVKIDFINKQFEKQLGIQGQEKVGPWLDKSKQTKALCDGLYNYLKGLKDTMIYASSYDEKTGKYKEDDLDASTRILVEGTKGKELYNKLNDLRKELLKLADKDSGEFVSSLPLRLEIPKTENIENQKDWQSAHFRMVPTIATITILTKFQNDIRNSQTALTDFFFKKINAEDIKFDQFEPFIASNATYLLSGQKFEATIGVGAFSSTSNPIITVNGRSLAATAGKAVYEEVVGGAGTKRLNVAISLKQPNGEMKTVNKELEYTVGVPGGATVTPDKMNVFYRGVDNPITVSGGSVGAEKVRVSMTNGELKPNGQLKYNIRPGAGNDATVTVNTGEGKPGSFLFRVKDIPDPIPMVGASKGGGMPAAAFKAQGGVRAVLENFDFQAAFQVVSYKVGANGRGFDNYMEATNNGAPWTGQAAGIINRALPGSIIFFDEIRAVGPDGKTRKLGSIAFNLR
jgi:gliding motility-associated protein GldM